MKPLICSLLLSLAPLCALAGNYPEKPIRLVVGFPQGGGVDLVARQFSGHLAKALGQPVNVENVLGEAGNKASREVAAAAPDGYTVMIVNPANIAINPSLYPNLGFDPQNAFAPVARMVVTPLMALIPASLSPQNMDEFITRLRTQKSLKYTSGGVGNINPARG
jgi:tripartite-type tricarboxylate transporter receptor subunit TctC